MSQTDAVRFLDAIETDEAFAQQLETLKDTPDQVLDAVRARGYDVDSDDVRDAFLERYGNDLTEEQLAAIAGGINTDDFIQGVVWGAGSVVSFAAAALVF